MGQISESQHNYLTTISRLMEQKSGGVRRSDIAKALDYSKPSVTVAVRKLEQDGYVSEQNGNIMLTDSGKEISMGLYEKRTVLMQLFESLGDNLDDALENARRMEHIVSDELLRVVERALSANKQESNG